MEDVNPRSLIAETNEAIVRSGNWYLQLKAAIDNLIVNDFSSLVQLLYKADVPEEKLKSLLNKDAGADASTIIASLLLQRQLEKIEARKTFSTKAENDIDDERW